MINFHPSSGGELKPRITVIGVGGAGGNAVNNMIQSHLEGVEFIVANTDAQAMSQSRTDRRIQLGAEVTQGLGAGARPDIGRAAAEETLDDIIAHLQGSNMVFITAGMGGGTGTGAAPVIARAAREHGILTVGVVTKPFHFEGQHRMRLAEQGIEELSQYVDTLIIIPNQNLFRIASERTTFADAFKMADDVLYSGVRGVTDLMIMPGLINLDFADIRTVMGEMGKAMMGTGEAEGEKRALEAAEAAISNPLLEDISMKGARGVLINITGGLDMTLFEVDEAANRIRDEVDPEANIIFGSTFDEKLSGKMRVSVVATGIDAAQCPPKPTLISLVNEPRRVVPGPTLKPEAAGSFPAQSQPVHAGPAGRPQADNEPHLRVEPAPLARNLGQGGAALGAGQPGLRHAAPAAPNNLRIDPVPPARPAHAAPAAAAPQNQGGYNLRVEGGQPRQEASSRPDPRLESRPAPATPSYGQSPSSYPPAAAPQQPADGDHPTEPRRASFLNRLAASVKNAHAQQSPAAPGGPPAVSQRTALHQDAAPQPQPAAPPAAAPAVASYGQAPSYTAPSQQSSGQGYTGNAQPAPARVNPADRPAPARQTDEDLLDIPAFLRRQAN